MTEDQIFELGAGFVLSLMGTLFMVACAIEEDRTGYGPDRFERAIHCLFAVAFAAFAAAFGRNLFVWWWWLQ